MRAGRRFFQSLLELSALWGIAVVQPILFILAENTDYFLRNSIVGWQAIVFAFGFALLPPLTLVAVEAAAARLGRMGTTVATGLHHASLLVLGLAGIIQYVKYGANREGLQLWVASFVAVAIGAYMWWKLTFLREWLRWLGVVPLVVALIFVITTPVGRFARAGDGRLVSGVESTTPVVMIMFDEFPVASLLDGSGGIDRVNYPNFARLAGMSTWYRMYSTTAEETQFAVPTSLSGVSARSGLGATYADHPDTLFSLLGRSHRMHVTESVTQLCPPAACGKTSTSPNWRSFFDGIESLFRQRVDGTLANEFDNMADNPVLDDDRGGELEIPAVEVQLAIPGLFRNVFTDWTAEIEASDEPTLHYVHVLLPHQPWILAPSGDTYRAKLPKPASEEVAWDVKVQRQRHMLQLGYLDLLVGAFLDRLESEGLLDEALVVVTADHGTSFVPNRIRRYAVDDYSNAPEIMGVPLFVKEPGRPGGVIDDSNIDNEDLLPLLARALGLDIPWTTDGTAPPPEGADDTKTLRFVVPPIGQKKRPDPAFTISLAAYKERLLSLGHDGVRGDRLAFLYAGTPHADLRGESLSSVRNRLSPVDVRLDPSIADADGYVVVEGTVSGVPGGSWLAIVSDGRVTGLAPVADDGSFVTLVLDPDGSPVTDPSFFAVDTSG